MLLEACHCIRLYWNEYFAKATVDMFTAFALRCISRLPLFPQYHLMAHMSPETHNGELCKHFKHIYQFNCGLLVALLYKDIWSLMYLIMNNTSHQRNDVIPYSEHSSATCQSPCVVPTKRPWTKVCSDCVSFSLQNDFFNGN